MPTTYPNGAGEMLGDVLATCSPLQMSSSMRFVHHDGTDGGGNTGLDKENPMATLAAAVAASTDNDMIILLDGHTETIGSTIALIQGLKVVGSGLSGGLPTVKLTNNAGNSLFTVAAAGVKIANIWFEENTLAAVQSKILLSSSGFRLRGCYFELGENDTNAAVQFNSGADSARISSTTFISTATDVSARPGRALRISAAVSDLELEGVVISSGAVGFSAAAIHGVAAVTRLSAEGLSLLLGADMSNHASTVGHINVETATGGAQVSW